MIRHAVLALAIVLLARPATAHVGSPDVFFEGDAGPYHLFVSVRMPQVIPGIATIEIRTRTTEIGAITVVPLRLTGPGSEHPPTPDRAERSADDPQFFSAELWLMEHGQLQVRIAVEGARGPGTLAVPITAVAQRTLTMDRTLGVVLLGLMLLLALSLVSIAGAAVREATLEPGVLPTARARRRSRIATAIAAAIVVGILGFGDAWWRAEARAYEAMVATPWVMNARVEGCRLTFPRLVIDVLADHGHDMHLFIVRTPQLDRLAHLHPQRTPDGMIQQLPSLPAGRYKLFADIVLPDGLPLTGTAELDLPDLDCPPLAGDDSSWSGAPSGLAFDRPPVMRAQIAMPLRFRVVNADGTPATDLEPYMAMAGHAAIVRKDLSVFAHLHPNGSIAMPALMLARTPHTMFAEGRALPPELSFPYGFPQPGDYRVFVQIKRAGRIETGAFDVTIEP
jgi:hypothetical protein